MIDTKLIFKKELTKDERIQFNEFYSKVPNSIKDYRRLIKKTTESDMIPCILQDIRNMYSPIILICGRPRSGKSVFALFISNVISTILYYQWFSLKDLYFFPKDLLRGINDYGNQILVLDEAGSSLNKRQWFTDFTFAFDQILQTQGYLNNVYIFVLPFASDLVKDCRKYVDFMCHTKRRGRLRCKKIYKREDQLVSDIKSFKPIYIEDLFIRLNDVPKHLRDGFESRSMDIKTLIRKNITRSLSDKKDWLRC